MTIKWDWQHTAIMIASAFFGAVGTYVQSQPIATIVSAMGSWHTAQPLVYGALGAGVVAICALAKDTFILAAPTSPPATRITPTVVVPPAPPPPQPPAAARASVARVGALLAGLAMLALFPACSPTTLSTVDNAVSDTLEYVQYVQTYEAEVKNLWPSVSALLGANAAAATKAFDEATTSLDHTIALVEDGAKGVKAGENVDLVTLFADVGAAALQVIAIYDQYATKPIAPGAAGASRPDTVHKMAATIAVWRP